MRPTRATSTPGGRRTAALAGAAALAGCSFLVPFEDFDRDYYASLPDGSGPSAVEGSTPIADGCAGDCDSGCRTADSSESCGECGHNCLGAPCVLGKCVAATIASYAFTDIVGIALDSSNAYGVGNFFGEGIVGRISKTTNTELVQLATKAGVPVKVVVRGSDLYFTTKGANPGIGHAPAAGDAGVVDASILVAQSSPSSIAVNDTAIFWTNTPGAGDVWQTTRTAPDAGITRTFSGPDAVAVALDAASLYWTVAGAEGKIMRANLDGSGATAIVPSAPWARYLVIDDTHVFWTASPPDAAGGLVMKAPKQGGAPQVLAGSQMTPGPMACAAADTHVYWVTANGVSRVSKTGGPALVLADGQDNIDLAVDTTHVYWVTKKDGAFEAAHEVKRVPK